MKQVLDKFDKDVIIISKELTSKQKILLEKFGWGMIEITVKGGKPVMVSLKQDFKVD